MYTFMSRRFVVISLTLLTAIQFGCKYRSFKVVMSLDEQGVVSREIEVSLSEGEGRDSDLSKDPMVLRVSSIYGLQVDSGKNWRRYKKNFVDKMPQDIEHGAFTNHATVSVEVSPLGRSVAYCERMPGRTRWSEVIDAGEKSIDLIIRALVAAFEQDAELKKKPEELKNLTEFLRGRFRVDIRDFLMEFWLVSAQEDVREKSPDSPLEQYILNHAFRIGNLMVERGYVASIRDVSMQDPNLVTRAVLSRLLKEMGPTAVSTPPRVLKEIMEDSKALNQMFEKGLAAIGSSQEELQRLLAPLDLNMFGDSTSGTVTWQTKNSPVASNGSWDAAKGEITWNAKGMDGPIPPKVLWAVWSEPNERFQRRHFGRILLRSELGQYNHWYAGLDPQHKKEWDRFLESLPGDNSVAQRLDNFKFDDGGPKRQTTTTPTDGVECSPYGGVEALKTALKDLPPLPWPNASQRSRD